MPESEAGTVAAEVAPPEILDLTTNDVPPDKVAAGSPPPPSSQPYDPLPQRENVRGRIAQSLILLLAILILFAFLTLWACPWASGHLKDLLTIFFGPVATLVGSAIGFYFGGGSGGTPSRT